MTKGFEFKDGDRTYTCTIETRTGTDPGDWWWFSVTDSSQRYAPFRAERGDTRASVQERIIAFYNNRVFQMSQPRERGSHWGRKRPAVEGKGPASPGA